MKNLNLPQISMEAISYQGRSLLLYDLVSSIELLRTSPLIDQGAVDRSGLSQAVAKRTGMRVSFVLSESVAPYENFAEPAVVDAGNPYFKLLASYGLADEALPALERHQRALRLATSTLAWVDLKEGRVGGLFSTLLTRLFLAQSLLQDRSFTSEEVAAVILHELGHIFSYFETVAYTTASNSVISTALEALQKEEDKTIRVKLITRSLSAFQVTDKSAAEAIAETTDETGTRVLLMRTIEQAQQTRVRQLSQERDSNYNVRSIEHMADQYAVRHGASYALATAQHKLAKYNGGGLYQYGRSKVAFLSVQAARYGALIMLSWISAPVGLAVMFMFGLLLTADAAESDRSGSPAERVARIKSDLVQLLKDNHLEPKIRKQLLSDVDAVDAVRQDAKEYDGVIRFLWRNAVPQGRRQVSLREFQKGLEDLINNPLFIHANRLKGD